MFEFGKNLCKEQKQKEYITKIDKLIKNIFSENPQFAKTSKLQLITNKPRYCSEFLNSKRDLEEDVDNTALCVLQMDRDDGSKLKIAIVRTIMGKYKIYPCEIDSQGFLTRTKGKEENILDPSSELNAILPELIDSLEKGIAKHPDFNKQETISSQDLEKLDQYLKESLFRQVVQIIMEKYNQDTTKKEIEKKIRAEVEKLIKQWNKWYEDPNHSSKKLKEQIEKERKILTDKQSKLQELQRKLEEVQKIHHEKLMELTVKNKVPTLKVKKGDKENKKREKSDAKLEENNDELREKAKNKLYEIAKQALFEIINSQDLSTQEENFWFIRNVFYNSLELAEIIARMSDLDILSLIDVKDENQFIKLSNRLALVNFAKEIGADEKVQKRLSEIEKIIKQNYINSWVSKDPQRIAKIKNIIKQKIESLKDEFKKDYLSVNNEEYSTKDYSRYHEKMIKEIDSLKEYIEEIKNEISKIRVEIDRIKTRISSYEKDLNRSLIIEEGEEKMRSVFEKERGQQIRQDIKSEISIDSLNLALMNLAYNYVENEELDSKNPYTKYSLRVSSKQIIIPSPKNNFETYRGFGGKISIEKISGDIILELPRNNVQVFEEVKILEQDLEYIKLAITERKLDGTQETWYLEFGENIKTLDQQGEKKACVNIICENGNKTSIIFGRPSHVMFVRKPVLCFRDFQQPTIVKIAVNFQGIFQVVYPEPQEKTDHSLVWKVLALPKNTLQIPLEKNGKEVKKEYPYLFWDGFSNYLQDIKFEIGFCISSQEVIKFLEEKCSLFAFDSKLTTDFVTFWAPYLMASKYTLVRWLTEEECQKLAKLEVTCQQKVQLIRMYMLYKPLREKVDIKPQQLEKVKLTKDPKIFDWGGFGAE